MLCQSCEKNPATTHIKKVVNGELTEYSLCSDCAQKMGYGNILNNFHFNFASLFDSVLGGGKVLKVQRCPICSSSFEDIVQSGKVGCAECYHTFSNRLLPYIQKIHGNTQHCGKNPHGSTLKIQEKHELQIKKEPKIDKLKRQLNQLIQEQKFEKAAVLRDEIKEMEGEGK